MKMTQSWAAKTSLNRGREISQAFTTTQDHRPAGEGMDFEVGFSLEDIAVEEMHKDCLAGRRGSTHKDNAVVKMNNNWPRDSVRAGRSVGWRNGGGRRIDKIK